MDKHMNVCRWCKWLHDGYCINEQAFDFDDTVDFPIWKFAEEGHLSESIKESFGDFDLTEIKKLLTKKLSKKATAEILVLFADEFEIFKTKTAETLDNQISTSLRNFDFDSGGVSISRVCIHDPNEFSCKYFG